eukprot:12884791-Ditylum_brightwellii.AAC.1
MMRYNQISWTPQRRNTTGDIKLGKAGKCQAYHILGNCRDPACTYMHNSEIKPMKPKVGKAAAAIEKAISNCSRQMDEGDVNKVL